MYNFFNEYLKTTQRGSILVSWHFPFLSGTQNCAGAEFSVEDIRITFMNFVFRLFSKFHILWKTKVQKVFSSVMKAIFKSERKVV